jgi:hypothetical protein
MHRVGWLDTIAGTQVLVDVAPALYPAYVLVLVLGLRKGELITVHGARTTCGCLLAALDVHPRVAMQILRHSKIAVTMEIFTEIPSTATREGLRKLGRWLGE